MGWVDPRVGLGWVGLGWEWVDNFYFWWVGLGHGSEIVVWGLGPVGLVWVGLGHGSTSSPGSGLGWVGLDQLFGGLGWVDEMNPWTTLECMLCTAVHC